MKTRFITLLLFICCASVLMGCNDTSDPIPNTPTQETDPLLWQQNPQGTPEQRLIRKSYVVSYNSTTMQPNWVAWQLTAEHTYGSVNRPNNAFREDLEVPYPRATLQDYKGSGWTRGHLCPAGDNKWDSDAMYETFLLSNICPQNDNLNSGVWNQIEISCREWAKRYGKIYIVCGPIFYRTEHERIGPNQIPVPEAFFKVILRLGAEPRAICYVCKNTDGSGKKDLYVNSLSQVERITGIKFFPSLSAETRQAIDAAGPEM
ncbi:DNA/RNA non-specific endonuclease [Pseudoprevotella muciniphila]|uniref:DNA/RNA non-specific endonuclease n=1 Tax=Pseudoprevotella muciniphila TaxID=2133944 RepID=A0A5P8E7A6_9BACT|nr:DNA/RNA non-specific endonuclease [Pseudoprevotella muciniphila]QFQ12818.1 DNA/RNA non-specific endonuclease [Pseudoprevotella muciniphila]